MQLQSHHRLSTTVLFLIVRVLFHAFPIHAQDEHRTVERFIDNVIQLTVVLNDDTIEHGFGFVIGEQDNTLYVVTANHVVRSDSPDTNAETISARFYVDRGKSYPATLLELSYEDIDLALLEVVKPSETYQWETDYFFPNPGQNTKVWFIGRNQEWWIPSDSIAGTINKPPSNIRIQFPVDIVSVEPGTSGAPLISQEGIVGMIVEDRSTEVSTLSISAIKNIVTTEWGYPWGLQEFSEDISRIQRVLDTEMQGAWVEHDFSFVESAFAPNAVIVHYWSDTRYTGLKEIHNFYAEFLSRPKAKYYTATDLSITVDENIATVTHMGIALDYVQYSDTATYCLEKFNDRWLITKIETGSDVNFGICP